jgi:hypothetical protein
MDFLKLSIPNKITFGRNVISRMTLIALFANPDVAYAALTEIVNKLERYYVSSRGGDHEQIALMHQAEEEFDNSFRKQAYYVNRISDGDEAVIISTGYNLAKQPIPSARVEFEVKAGNAPGNMWMRRKAFPGALSYVWQYYVGSDVPKETDWSFASATTQVTFEMNGFTSGDKVWFRVAAVTKNGMGSFTHPIMKVVP